MGLPRLTQVLRHLKLKADPRVLVGLNPADDAGVFQLSEQEALIFTTDFFTPIVDDPYDYGAIAAANTLSDIYAMGGQPLIALNIVGFPKKDLSLEALELILKGGAEKVEEAGAAVIGGHTIESEELFYGMAVTGRIHPQQIIKLCGARPGDKLVLTKPLGVGVVTAGLKSPKLSKQDRQTYIKSATQSMQQLNAVASRLMVEHKANACTDITGFGLLGHCWELAKASNVGLIIQASSVPLLPGALEFSRQGIYTRVYPTNKKYLAADLSFDSNVSEEYQKLLLDSETSGGLLISLPASNASSLLKALHTEGIATARIIGQVTAHPPQKITIKW